MKKLKKNILVTLLSGVIFTSGVIGAVMAKAQPYNLLAFECEGNTVAAFVGETVDFGDVKALYPDRVEMIRFFVESPDGSNVEHDGDSFVATKEGNYTVRVCVVGKNGETYMESYNVVVTTSTTPILSVAPIIPVAFLEGFKYSVPEATFIDYNTTLPTVAEYKVSLIDEYGKEKAVSGEFLPEVDLHGATVVLKYVSKSSVTGEEFLLEYPVPVLESVSQDEYGDKVYAYDKMFLTQAVQRSEVTSAGATFYGSDDFAFSFANKLHASFTIALKSLEGYTNFDSAVIVVSDSANPSERITIEVCNQSTAKVRINGGETLDVSGSLLDLSKGVSFTFNNGTCVLEDIDGKNIATIKKTADGKEFCGFSSKFVNLTVGVKQVTSKSAIAVENLNGHELKLNHEYDTIFPSVVSEKEIIVKNAVGEKILIPRALAYDVIDPFVSARVSVFNEIGESVKSIDGTELLEASATREYELVLTDPGEYTVQYIAEDASGNLYDYSYYLLFVIDINAPTISVAQMKSEVKLGDVLTIPKPKIFDNLSAAENIQTWVTVICPDNRYEWVQAGSKYKFSKKGTYFIRYSAMDENNNLATYENVVVCK